MSCISWNCRGLGSPRTVRALKDLLKACNPSFVFLMETLSYADRIDELRRSLGFDFCFAVDRVGRSGGLAILWKSNFPCEVLNYSSNHIDVAVLDNRVRSWRMSCFYGFPERGRRRDSWNLIRRLSGLDSLPWLILGDFNDLLYVTDKKGENPHPSYLLNGFREVITDCHLLEIDLCGGKFTWEKSRGSSTWVREKLDRGFASQSWWAKFPLCNLRVVQTSCSDHDPIHLVLLKMDISQKKFRFRFENMWLKEDNFVAEVTEAWQNIPSYHLLPKLIEVSSFMARWGRTFFHKFKEKVRDQKRIMDDLVDRTDDDSVRAYLNAKDKLNELIYQEEAYWKQRAKMFWLAEGDENTKFFHANASARKNRTTLVTWLMTMEFISKIKKVWQV